MLYQYAKDEGITDVLFLKLIVGIHEFLNLLLWEHIFLQHLVINDTDNSKEQDIRELFDSVKKIIDIKLNDTQRNVLWLRDYEGYSFEEIAKKTGRTEANVRQILSRARKVIRETYKTIN